MTRAPIFNLQVRTKRGVIVREELVRFVSVAEIAANHGQSPAHCERAGEGRR